MFGDPEYAYTGNQMYYRFLWWLEQVDLIPSLLLISLYWLKEETQSLEVFVFVFVFCYRIVTVCYILIRKSKTIYLENLEITFEAYFP